MTECSIDGCTSPSRKRGWCENHYNRWLRHGDPLGKLRTITCQNCGEQFETRGSGNYRACSDSCKKELSRVATGKWRNANREAHYEMTMAWRERNQDRHRNNQSRGGYVRRARIKEASIIHFTVEELHARLSMWSGCWMCGSLGGLEIDHVKPISKGGPHILANLRPICVSCNRKKRNKWPLLVSNRRS